MITISMIIFYKYNTINHQKKSPRVSYHTTLAVKIWTMICLWSATLQLWAQGRNESLLSTLLLPGLVLSRESIQWRSPSLYIKYDYILEVISLLSLSLTFLLEQFYYHIVCFLQFCLQVLHFLGTRTFLTANMTFLRILFLWRSRNPFFSSRSVLYWSLVEIKRTIFVDSFRLMLERLLQVERSLSEVFYERFL